MKLILILALRNIFRQKKRSFFTASSIAISYLLFSIFIGIDIGSYGYMINMYTKIHNGHIQIQDTHYPKTPLLKYRLSAKDLDYKSLEATEEIILASPRVRAGALAHLEDKSLPVAVIGIIIEDEDPYTAISKRLSEGRIFKSDRELIIGSKVAKLLKAELFDQIALVSQALDGSLANDLFSIVGIIGGSESPDQNSIYMSLENAQEFYFLGSSFHQIVIHLSQAELAPEISQRIKTKLTDPRILVESWQESEKEFYQTMLADRKGNRIMHGIIVGMVALAILNTVFMLLIERRREYGVLKALGTQPRQIVGLILLENFLLTSMSLCLGALISLPTQLYLSSYGILLATSIDIGGLSYDRILGSLEPKVWLEPWLVILAVSLLVSAIPSWIAARDKPLKDLRSL